MREFADLSKRLALVLASLMCTAGMWIYADRVLVGYQVAEAAAHNRPRGNLSDLYPRWLGARELLLNGRNPYSAQITREIQVGYYGRALDASRPGDPKDQAAFAYPAYVVFYLAPTVRLPFPAVQRFFFWLLVALTIASVLLWLRTVHWPLPWWEVLIALALFLGSMPVMQGLKLQQITLFVAPLMALAVLLLVRGHYTPAGILLALATIKPQLLVGLLFWLALWTLADWRRRRWAVSFAFTMLALAAGAELLLPHWISQFIRAAHEYQSYTGAVPMLDKLLPWPLSRLMEFGCGAAAIWVCWKNRNAPLRSGVFAATTSLVLAATLLVVPTFALYNQVLLLPALLLLARHRRAIWQRSATARLLLGTIAVLLGWQWLSSTALAVLSYLLPADLVQRGWAVPGWTVLTLPVAVTALMLLEGRHASLGISPERVPS